MRDSILADARRKIEQLFLEQCVNGVQSKDLPDGVLACGQFVGDGARTIKQRGFHGTAAAITVLSRSTEENARDAVRCLVKFVELSANGTNALVDDLDQNVKNTIKQSELLYALSLVPTATAATESVRQQIATRLLDGRRDPSGAWGFFLDKSDPTVDPIPTAYATIALARHGYRTESRKAIDYLLGVLTADGDTRTGLDSVTTLLVIHAVIESLDRELRPQLPLLRQHFRRARAVLEPQLREQIEQNVEYWRGSENYYIRIPWQLYYACAERRLASVTLWPSMKLHRLLTKITRAAGKDGFRYPHSGRMLSSRSNAILYDVLTGCLSRPRSLLHTVTVWLDSAREFVGLKPIRLTIAIAAAALALVSTSQFFSSPDWRMRDFAPDLLSALLIFALGFAKTR